MIRLYCRKKHGYKKQLCPECSLTLDYARERTEKCPFGANKPVCSKCKVHCYKPEFREKIRTIMRFSGPRMILYHPLLAIKHLRDQRRNKK